MAEVVAVVVFSVVLGLLRCFTHGFDLEAY